MAFKFITLQRKTRSVVGGVESLDADLIDMRKKGAWTQTQIHGDDVGRGHGGHGGHGGHRGTRRGGRRGGGGLITPVELVVPTVEIYHEDEEDMSGV